MNKRVLRLHKRSQKIMEELENRNLPQVEYNAIISFRIPQILKNTFTDICSNNLVTPRKYVTGNVLRRFVYCYIQDPNFFENIFISFENGTHTKEEKNKF